MKMAPVSVFGYLGFVCSAEPGESTTVPLGEGGKYDNGAYFFFEGRGVPTVEQTGEVLPTREVGWLNTEHVSPAASSGDLCTAFPDGAKWFCIPANKNTVMPQLQSVSLGVAEELQLVPGDRIFVLSGALDIGSERVTAPKAVKVSAAATAYVVSPVMALKFL
jgi:hypothetical protein